jgi:ABC-type Fe3+ transport system substrate-binding protein
MKTILKGIRLCFRAGGGLFLTAALLCLVWHASAVAQAKPDWKAKWEKVLAGAKKEGKVIVLGPPGDLIREGMTQGFKKAFPEINIEYTGGRSGEQATKLKAERDGGIYGVDVFLAGTSTANLQLKPIGAQDPIEPVLILPEVTELKYWRNNALEFSDKEGKYNLVFVNNAKPPVIYNPNQVKPEEIDELYELLSPKWKGKIVLNDPLPTGAGNVQFRWIWQVLGPEKGTDYYRKIRAQAAVVDRDQRRQIEWVAQGKYPILLAHSDGVLAQLLESGLKVGVLPEFKDYGTYITASFGSANLINKGRHPNAAQVFMNWVLTKDGQTAWSKAMDHVSRRVDVSTAHLPPYVIPKPGVKYWISHHEKEVRRSPEEEKILKELFGR